MNINTKEIRTEFHDLLDECEKYNYTKLQIANECMVLCEKKIEHYAKTLVSGNKANQSENKKEGEVALSFAEAESFIEFLNSNFEKYISRWELIGKPERGNWTLKEVYEKYKDWKANDNDR